MPGMRPDDQPVGLLWMVSGPAVHSISLPSTAQNQILVLTVNEGHIVHNDMDFLSEEKAIDRISVLDKALFLKDV